MSLELYALSQWAHFFSLSLLDSKVCVSDKFFQTVGHNSKVDHASNSLQQNSWENARDINKREKPAVTNLTIRSKGYTSIIPVEQGTCEHVLCTCLFKWHDIAVGGHVEQSGWAQWGHDGFRQLAASRECLQFRPGSIWTRNKRWFSK